MVQTELMHCIKLPRKVITIRYIYSLNTRAEGHKVRAVQRSKITFIIILFFSDLARIPCTERNVPAGDRRHLPADGPRDGRVSRQAPQITH